MEGFFKEFEAFLNYIQINGGLKDFKAKRLLKEIFREVEEFFIK
jgi:hypothetical protein